MKEGPKTLAFVAVAILLSGAAWLSRSGSVGDTNEGDATGKLYADFKDPLAAKSLEIVGYDEDTGTVEPFKVAQVKGVWSIPSHSDYPADAAKQLADAATSMMDLEKLGIATRSPSEHELYNVVDPKSANLAAGATGVGKRVTLRDGSDNILADYILGKADEKQAGIRFLRIPNQDPVYRVAVSTDKLSTRFGDWIEKDLLKMNAFDVKQVTMDNYSVDEVQRRILQESRVVVDFDSKDSKWSLVDMKGAVKGKGWAEIKLAPDEELNNEKLNDLKNALDELQIVDVSRKPPGLAADLQIDEKTLKESSQDSLAAHGFTPAMMGGKMEIFSNEGEVHCGMNDGVEYVLRFGEIAGPDREAKDKEGKDKKDDKPAAKPAGAAVNRYIMVTTRFNKSLLDEPDLEDLPALPAKAGPAAPEKKPEGEKKPEAEKKTEDKSDKKKPAAKEPAEKDEKQPEGDSCGADDPAASDKQPAEKEPAKEAPKTEIELERERIQLDNKRKQEEFDTKVKEGEKKVKDLNARFASWYYIISNATYEKIHLSRDQLIKKKEQPKPEGESAPGADEKVDPFKKFQDIEKQGLPK